MRLSFLSVFFITFRLKSVIPARKSEVASSLYMSCLKSGQTELSHPVTCLAYGATISSKALFRGSRGQNSCSFHLFMLQLQFTDLLSSSFFSIFPVVPCVIEFPGPLRVPNYSCPPMLSESPSLLSSSSIISSLESSESSEVKSSEVIDSSEHSPLDLILCTLAVLQQSAPLILVP